MRPCSLALLADQTKPGLQLPRAFWCFGVFDASELQRTGVLAQER